MASSSHPASLSRDGSVQAFTVPKIPLRRLPATQDERAPSRSNALAMRLVDVLVSALLLFVLAPLLVLIGMAIRLDSPGPVLFRQSRTGLHGRVFRIYKFRTMHVLEDGPEIQQARAQDARVTRVGRLLRRTHLDELPQLLNVLRGDMALVGPRPHALAHDAYYSREIPAYRLRFQVKPGITGWAQVNGAKGETPTLAHMQQRIELDLWYVHHKSLALDLAILVRTGMSAIAGRHPTY